MHECVYHVQGKDGFQYLCVDGQFSKIQSHIGFSIIVDVEHSVLQYPTTIISVSLQYIANTILLTCEIVCDIIIA